MNFPINNERLARALDVALEAGSTAGADAVEVSFDGGVTDFVRFASSRFTQVGTTQSENLRVRVLAKGRLGVQLGASLDPDAVAATARAATEAADRAPALDVPLSFTSAADDDDARPRAIPQTLSATDAPALLADAFASHGSDGVQFAGSLKSHQRTTAVRTSAGCDRFFSGSNIDAQLIGLAGTPSGYAGQLARTAGEVDIDKLASIAADKARRSADATELAPGPMDVVLAPAAIAELLEWMVEVSFSSNALLDGTSLLAGRVGEQLVDSAVHLSDACAEGDAPFDAEGTRRTEVVFLDHGRGGAVMTDQLGAARLNAAQGEPRGSTGHAPPIADPFATGPVLHHLMLRPGTQSEADLVSSVRRGLYITRFHYVNGLLNPRKATMTGMTRDGTFLIEDGEIRGAVANLRFTENMLEALSRLDGLGSELGHVPTWWSEGGVISAPAVLLRQFHFTGSSH